MLPQIESYGARFNTLRKELKEICLGNRAVKGVYVNGAFFELINICAFYFFLSMFSCMARY